MERTPGKRSTPEERVLRDGGGSEASVKRVRKSISSSSSVGSTNEAPLILILEMFGFLIGIDLNHPQHHHQDDGCVPVPVLFHVDLQRSRHPVAMRHVKTDHGGGEVKHYLLGGLTGRLDEQGDFHYGYSNKIYKLDADFLSRARDDVKPSDVLDEISTTLTDAKCPTAIDLGGTTYLLHRFRPYTVPGIRPDISFERLDASTQSWHKEQDPPFYLSWPEQDPDGNVVPMEIDGQTFDRQDFGSYFVVGNKLLLFCDNHKLNWFTPGNGNNNGEGAWDTSIPRYQDVSKSFMSCGAYVPKTGLWLYDFSFPGNDSLGVLLSLSKSYAEAYNPRKKSKHVNYTVRAYAMCKTTFEANFYQQLDEVFSGILPHPASDPLDSSTVTYRFLDLGKGDGEDTRRICALLTGRGLKIGILYLFVSIFDLQMIPEPIDLTKYRSRPCSFLNVSPPVKKRAFSFIKDPSIPNQHWHEAYSSNMLDAFVL